MRRSYMNCMLVLLGLGLSICSFAQQTTTVSGSVKNAKSKEAVSAVSVTVKGGTAGTFTDDKGNFKLSTVQKIPFTLTISSVGYTNKEVVVSNNNQTIDVELDATFTLGDEVVVAASRVPERILESPVSIERIGTSAIRSTPATNYYDMITNLKGVDVVTASLTFKSIGTRGFNSSGNTRLNQIVDGMDNQAPGLNFSVGNIIGLTELDVDNIELLPGASSALYGPGGMNGTVLINSKNPFKYQGLSFQIKQGVNHVDNIQRNASPFYDWTVRWANKISEKFAYKIGAQYTQAQDWVANQTDNYSRLASAANPNGNVIPGWRESDPNYDGVNVYGDETSANLSSVANAALATFPSALVNASNAWLAANPSAKLTNFNSFLTAIGAGALVAGGGSPFIFGASPTHNYFNNQFVSRTGYNESDVIDPTTSNFKLSGGLYYKINDKIEASVTANWGTGTTVYTGADRYSIKDFKMGQYKAELKAKNWYLRGYTTAENSGNSYVTTTTTRLFNEAWKPSTSWYPQYAAAYIMAADAGAPTNAAAHNAARAFADQGRPTGFQLYNPLFQAVAQKPISQGGGLFLDRTKVYTLEGQYNLTDDLGLSKTGTELLVGGSWRQYVLNSQGTIFADTAGTIKIAETGAYAQLSQKLFEDILKITVSGRYDKNVNFAGHFTPRAAAVVKLAKDHNLRFSYQSAYRFPTTQNQWINLNTSQGRLLGGLPQLRDFFKFSTNPAYTLASVQAFGASALAGAPNPALLQQQQFGEFKPESSTSFEVGYKGLIAKKLMIDVYAYWAKYKDFLGGVTVLQSNNGSVAGLIGLNPNFTPGNPATTRNVYSVSVNQTADVTTNGWGASAEYLLPQNFSVSGNIYSDMIGDVPVGFVSYFNTPKTRINLSLNNSGFGPKNLLGFSVVYRWLDSFHYDGTFASGEVPSYQTFDAMVSLKFPKTKSLLKVGATNLFNKYYRTGFGNPQIGGLYYISFGWNVF